VANVEPAEDQPAQILAVQKTTKQKKKFAGKKPGGGGGQAAAGTSVACLILNELKWPLDCASHTGFNLMPGNVRLPATGRETRVPGAAQRCRPGGAGLCGGPVFKSVVSGRQWGNLQHHSLSFQPSNFWLSSSWTYWLTYQELGRLPGGAEAFWTVLQVNFSSC
jgi:hypothetical protein